MKNQHFGKRLGFALNGLKEAFNSEASFRTQSFLGIMAIAYFAWLNVTAIWWGMLALVIALILAAEMINTAIEILIDHLHPGMHPTIKQIKDIAAGAVLLLSFSALIIAILATIQFW